jgi:hypothetical protein
MIALYKSKTEMAARSGLEPAKCHCYGDLVRQTRFKGNIGFRGEFGFAELELHLPMSPKIPHQDRRLWRPVFSVTAGSLV